MASKASYLSIGAIFKNEAPIMEEWINHYLNEGVDHFYLVDNGSNDNYVEILQPYVKSGLVTLFIDPQRFVQVKLYNKYVKPFKRNTDWFLICDFDEFIYARNDFKTIKDYLISLPASVSQVYIPWKMFGSSGIISQPDLVIPNFVNRSVYEGKKLKQGLRDPKNGFCKTIVRSKYLLKFRVHYALVWWWTREITSDGRSIQRKKRAFQRIDEEIIEKSALNLNHYAIQSLEWFRNIKSKRGSVNNRKSDYVKSQMKYFEEFDFHSNDMEDHELAKKRY